LVEKGIRENPSYWRLYFTLGFIHYVDRHDPKAAEQAFLKGSEVPGALSWMKVMAARMAEHAQESSTAAYLWKAIYDSAADKQLKDTAEKHLISLRVESELDQLERITQEYYHRRGAYPEEWSDLIKAGFLRGVPVDPNGVPYRLRLDGTVQVADAKKFIYLERHGKPLNK
jgi:hypothetical protein